ncbi:regulator of microtubule dynamics protein 2-like [Mercenaria mercenaria]|uniref:regulator of microtubule dynamics protein 2-like n=1 Tax=Mercenaria mercenaria TaxID=6596 RepID=UPI001E1D6D52|nr:regulator of microtubule dynamics protein 2-like [Mercenaria mercenaria]
MNFFRQNNAFFASLGAGMVIGIMYWRMTQKIMRELHSLSGVIAELQTEVCQLKEKVDNAGRRRKSPGSGFFSLGASSGDDDEEVYEEAYGGSDLEDLEEQIIITPTQTEQEIESRDEVFTEVDQLLEGTDEDKEKAFDILQRNKSKYLTDANFYWRLSKTTFQVSQILGARGDAEKKKEYVYTAKDLAQKALDLDDQCANAHKWFAITIGSIGEYEGTQEKIKNGFIYKEHIGKAISLKPKDPSNHYLLGRWCYSVYMLSWIERKAAAALFATPPTSTAEEAVIHFLKADELNPGKWKENILFIAKCYIEMRQYQEAVKWLIKGQQIPTVSQDDKESEIEIGTLLAKYRSY